jgi:hypothetical protein
MSGERIHRSMTRTPEEERRLQEIRERFQQERPGLDDLLASGDTTEVAFLGMRLPYHRCMMADASIGRRVPRSGFGA